MKQLQHVLNTIQTKIFKNIMDSALTTNLLEHYFYKVSTYKKLKSSTFGS